MFIATVLTFPETGKKKNQMSFNELMDSQTVVHPHTGIQLSNRGSNQPTQHPQMHCADQKEPGADYTAWFPLEAFCKRQSDRTKQKWVAAEEVAAMEPEAILGVMTFLHGSSWWGDMLYEFTAL